MNNFRHKNWNPDLLIRTEIRVIIFQIKLDFFFQGMTTNKNSERTIFNNLTLNLCNLITLQNKLEVQRDSVSGTVCAICIPQYSVEMISISSFFESDSDNLNYDAGTICAIIACARSMPMPKICSRNLLITFLKCFKNTLLIYKYLFTYKK